MMNKWCWLLLITLCWFAAGFTIFAGRQAQTSSTIPLPGQTDRIVSMAPSLTEILYALGLDEEIVAVTLHSDYPPAAAKKPKVGTFRQPNIEAVIAARPDLVITLGFDLQRNLAERLKRLGCNCLTLNIETVDELFEAIEKIGVATAKKTQADGLVSNLRKKLKNTNPIIRYKAEE